MDGASKFVRGDAVAGLLILIINILGGLTIGMTQYDMSFTDAGEIYVLLTIGDGLVTNSLFGAVSCDGNRRDTCHNK